MTQENKEQFQQAAPELEETKVKPQRRINAGRLTLSNISDLVMYTHFINKGLRKAISDFEEMSWKFSTEIANTLKLDSFFAQGADTVNEMVNKYLDNVDDITTYLNRFDVYYYSRNAERILGVTVEGEKDEGNERLILESRKDQFVMLFDCLRNLQSYLMITDNEFKVLKDRLDEKYKDVLDTFA
ncbi:hypothetical protein CKF54_00370 [Psittacicella hinzii]|uniref:Uncharacterized protein n=1 Tax=Psittacicella hinzii TaxID=2028575 RepID=A0A3A1YE66_9GAMM|nr:hypothetical protein [Psittacicella hinzii]RIY34484.1 hypothetical protein CKF54_00370 [Psittacicella hinzii]